MKRFRVRLCCAAVGLALLAGVSSSALLGVCGPFTDVAADAFCPFVLEIFYLGITTGTTATTFDPASNVTRLQMAAFLSRTVDGVLKRGSRRAVLDQFWTTQNGSVLGVTTAGVELTLVRSDGADLWVGDDVQHSVHRVRGSDGKLLETWTGAVGATGLLVAAGRVFATSNTNSPGLYRIDPSQPAGAVTVVATNIGTFALGIAFDGARIWTSSQAGSVSIVTPGATLPYTVTTVTAGFTLGTGMLYDGSNIWMVDRTPQALRKLDASGAILQSVTVGASPQFPVFDGANIWVPNAASNNVTVIRSSNGAILATLTGNGLTVPGVAAFDGQRVLVTNETGNSVSLWKAADLSVIGNFGTGASSPFGACSDGIHFWLTFSDGRLARF